MHKNGLVLDFIQTTCVMQILASILHFLVPCPVSPPPLYKAEKGAIRALEKRGMDVIEECAIPKYHKPVSIELPECPAPTLHRVIEEYQALFRTTPGVTEAAYRQPSTGTTMTSSSTLPTRRRTADTHYAGTGDY